MKTMKVIGMVAVVAMLAGSAHAILMGPIPPSQGTYNLADLIQGQTTVYHGDKVFSDWNFGVPIAYGDTPIGASDIMVDIFNEGSTYYLQFAGPLVAAYGSVFDYQIFYSVATVDQAPRINAIDQAFNLTSVGGGTIAIGETVWDGGYFIGNVVAQSSVGFVAGVADYTDPEGEDLDGDQLVINPPLSKVWVTKDIFLKGNQDGLVGATILRQSFHQAVPDGGMTVTLLGIAVAGFAMVKRVFRG